MQNKYYVYVYLDPRRPGNYVYGSYTFDYEPFYVGKGTGYRKYVHLCESNKHRCTNIIKGRKIKKIVASGYDLKEYVIEVGNHLYHNDALALESLLISSIGQLCEGTGPLTNIHKIGGRTSDPRVHALRSQKQKEAWTPERRRKHSELIKSLRAAENTPYKNVSFQHDNNGKQISYTRKAKFKTGELSLKGAKNSRAKTWEFISPTGQKYIIKGESKLFCEQQGLSSYTMQAIAKGKINKLHRGWTCRHISQ